MVSRVRNKDPTIFPVGNDGMLRTKFWSGLCDDRIKSALHYLMNSDASYHTVIETAIQIEAEEVKKSRNNQATEIENQNAKKLDQALATLELIFRSKDLKNQRSLRSFNEDLRLQTNDHTLIPNLHLRRFSKESVDVVASMDTSNQSAL